MDIYYFTYTGTSKKIASWLGEKFKLIPKEIKTYKLPYFIWLLLSFIPYLPIKASFDPPSNDIIIVCFPKWTFNCPPITYFLKKIYCKKLILIITYKGWGEKSYAKIYKNFVSKKIKETEVIFIKRKLWELGVCPEINI